MTQRCWADGGPFWAHTATSPHAHTACVNVCQNQGRLRLGCGVRALLRVPSSLLSSPFLLSLSEEMNFEKKSISNIAIPNSQNPLMKQTIELELILNCCCTKCKQISINLIQKVNCLIAHSFRSIIQRFPITESQFDLECVCILFFPLFKDWFLMI